MVGSDASTVRDIGKGDSSANTRCCTSYEGDFIRQETN